MSTATSLPGAAAFVEPAFARHETFHPRYGWLKKGYDAAAIDPSVFIDPDNATTRLGVGKNMVRAIRYWCLAYKVLEERPNPDKPRRRDMHATPFGSTLLGDVGLDPYLEDPGSLWLLHWQLLRPPCKAPAWWAIFNTPRVREFTDETLTAELRGFCDARPEWGPIVDNSLLKDARCLLRMYASATQGRDLVEDSIDSPFMELDLIRPVPGLRRHYVVNHGKKPTLPAAVIAYACLDYARMTETTAKVLSLSSLTQAPGSPGRAFGLTETMLAAGLQRAVEQHPEAVGLSHAAGARQLTLRGDVDDTKQALLREHYRPVGRLA